MPKRLQAGEKAARQRDWIMVRLRRTTRAALDGLAERWTKARDAGRETPEPESDLGYSLDQLVRELLAHYHSKRRRSARARTARGRAASDECNAGKETVDHEEKLDS